MFTIGFGLFCFAVGGLWTLKQERKESKDVTRLE